MRKISVINYKGGTGKTATVVNLGHALALRGKRVLIVDTDSQGSASFYLGIQPKYTLYDLLVKEESIANCIMPARANLDIICANERLFPAEMQLIRLKDREKILTQKLANLTNYDYVLMDCAPSLNIMNQNVLVYTDEIFLPVSMEYLALFGIKQLLNNITIINKILKHHVRISKVIPTFYDKRFKKSQDVLNSLQRAFPGKVTAPIRNCVAISESAGFNKTIFEYDPLSNGVIDYKNLSEEVLKND
jgi:chromosome partitioning protein